MNDDLSSVFFLQQYDHIIWTSVLFRFSLSSFEPGQWTVTVISFRSVMALGSGVDNGMPVPVFELADCNTSSSSLTPLHDSSQGEIPRADANPFPEIDPHQIREFTKDTKARGFDQLVIIDARFDYEYAGGHIRDAINVRSEAEMKRLFDEFSGCSACLIFHCEFSKNRGPTLMQDFRQHDRVRNISRYPELTYPTIYLLRGGYKEFYHCCPDLCDGEYVPMRAEEFVVSGQLKRSYSFYCAHRPSQSVVSTLNPRCVADGDDANVPDWDCLCHQIGPMDFDGFLAF
jgi:rhodanese-related sulfurtransferase